MLQLNHSLPTPLLGVFIEERNVYNTALHQTITYCFRLSLCIGCYQQDTWDVADDHENWKEGRVFGKTMSATLALVHQAPMCYKYSSTK